MMNVRLKRRQLSVARGASGGPPGKGALAGTPKCDRSHEEFSTYNTQRDALNMMSTAIERYGEASSVQEGFWRAVR